MTLLGKHAPRTDIETEKLEQFKYIEYQKPQRETTRNHPSGVANSVTERNFLWLGVDHIRLNDTKNQSIPICKRNKCI